MRSFPLRYGRGRRSRTLNQWFWRPLLYQLSYTPMNKQSLVNVRLYEAYINGSLLKISGFLSSREASLQVLSAFAGLTAVFGMGTGGSPQPSPLNYLYFKASRPDNCIDLYVFLNDFLVLTLSACSVASLRSKRFTTFYASLSLL